MTTQIIALVVVGILLVTAIQMSKPKEDRPSGFSWSSLFGAILITLATAGGLFLCMWTLLSV